MFYIFELYLMMPFLIVAQPGVTSARPERRETVRNT